MEEFDVGDLVPKVISFKSGNRKFALKEATADAARIYHNHLSSAAQVDDEGKVRGVKQLSDAETIVLAECVIEMTGGKAEKVPLETIRTWRYEVTSVLFDKLKEMSPRLVKVKDDSKNSQKASTTKDSPNNTTATSDSARHSENTSMRSSVGKDH